MQDNGLNQIKPFLFDLLELVLLLSVCPGWVAVCGELLFEVKGIHPALYKALSVGEDAFRPFPFPHMILIEFSAVPHLAYLHWWHNWFIPDES